MRNLFGPLGSRWLAQVRANEEAWVADHRRAKRLTLHAVGWTALVLASIVVRTWLAPGSWADVAAGLLLGAFAGVGALGTVRRGIAYRSGWLDGRMRMVHALTEAQQRGMGLHDWLAGELDRDHAVLGLPPASPQADQNDD